MGGQGWVRAPPRLRRGPMPSCGMENAGMNATEQHPIDVVAFDFDGTLADTRPAIVATALETLRELGHPAAEEERIVQAMGLPLAQLFVAAGVAPEDSGQCAQRYRQRFAAHVGKVCLFPTARECLIELRAHGLSLAIVSSRGRASLHELLELLSIRDFFRVVLGDEDVVGKKPAPDLLHEVARRLATAPARMLVVGDTTYDVEMGHAAGAQTCAVTHGSHGWPQLERARPTHRLDSLSQLGALLAP